MITYNQGKFIEQAIKSVVKQKASYSFELVIGEDNSTDDTRSICKELAEKYNSMVTLLPSEVRLGMANNFIRTLSNCKGKYIALCDGDDYWCDPHKLQKQVDFLEANPAYAICCHRIYIKKGGQKPMLYADEYMPSKETTYDIDMMAKNGNLIATPSVVYRNKMFLSLPRWFDQSPIADYVLHMMNARYGKIKYFPEPMAVYREHSKGAWSGQSVMTNASNMIKTIELLLTEPFDEPVKNGLRGQLRMHKGIYLNELVHKDWDRFCKEFNEMILEDGSIALSMVEKMKKDMDSFRGNRIYKTLRKAKKLIKRNY
jgi:glycosyltransferase involved in cell wall biosynthesis